MANKRNKGSQAAALMTRKILLAAGVGTVTYLITEKLIADDGPMSLMTSVVLAGVVFVAQFLVEVQDNLSRVDSSLDQRANRLESAQRNHLSEIDEKINLTLRNFDDAIAVYQALVNSSLNTQNIHGMIRNAVQIDSNRPGLVAGLAESQIHRLEEFLRHINYDGRATYEGEDRDWLLALTSRTQSTLLATSLAKVDGGGSRYVDGGLWRTDLGLRYLNLQREAIEQRGVDVKRILITETPEDAQSEAFTRIIKQQRDAGIDARVLFPEAGKDIPTSMHDVIIFDNEVVYETTSEGWPTQESPVTLRAEVTIVPDTVEQRIKSFNALWSQAEVLETS